MASHTDTTPPSPENGEIDPNMVEEPLQAAFDAAAEATGPFADFLTRIFDTLAPQIASPLGAAQAGAVVAAGVIARLMAPGVRAAFARLAPRAEDREVSRLQRVISGLTTKAIWLVLLWSLTGVFAGLGYANDVIRLASSLLSAWIVIRLVSAFVADPVWARLFALSAWTIAALNALRLLTPTIELLDGLALTVGDLRVSLYLILKAFGIAIVLLWLASTVARVIQGRVNRSRNLTPSVQTLIIQGVRLSLMLAAILVALNTVGIDLTAFAVLSGAIGVGLGFGLQKIVSNFVSGVIILSDKSIKPGDVVEVGDTYGWVTSLGARYAAIRTRDGTEHLIPNEEFIINRVINWTHSDNAIRRKIPIGVSYDTDLDRAIALIKEAVAKTPRVLAEPKVNVLVRGFGDSAVDLEARFWIADPAGGVANVSSDCYLNVWRALKEAEIEIPFPQRDLHIRSNAAGLGRPDNAGET